MTKTLKYYVASLFFLLIFPFFLGSKSVNRVSADEDLDQCKHENAECDVNNSGKLCCAGLTCMDKGVPSDIGKCQNQSSPTNTPVPTPTEEVTPTPTPTEENECKNENAECDVNNSGLLCCAGLTCVDKGVPSDIGKCQNQSSPTNTPIPTPTEEVTGTPAPTATPTSSGNNDGGGGNGGGGNPGAPACNDQKPGTPSNLRVTRISPTQIRLDWNHAADPHTSYLVAYGPSIGNYPWGSPDIGNGNNYTVKSLTPGAQYCFYVRAQNGCMPGDKSNEVCINVGSTIRILGVTDNYNPLVDGIKESYGGEVLGESTELMGTAEVVYSTDKLPSGNTLLEGRYISIPVIGVNQPLYQPQIIADQFAVGHHEVLNTTVNGSNVYYGHNGYDVFGSLYRVIKGNQIIVSNNNQKLVYTVTGTEFVKKDNVAVLETNANQIVLVTCSFTQPDYRIVVKASLQP
jgi:LPXTG-site transpeptidase (sortase) family protein